jgi:hypothetical protein
VQQIKSKEHDPVWRLMDGPAQGIKVRDAVLFLDDYLAIDQGPLAAELGAAPTTRL